MELATVKTAWLSKINWTAWLGIFGMVLTAIGAPEDVRVAAVTGVGALTHVAIWVFRTWYTTSLTAASVE